MHGYVINIQTRADIAKSGRDTGCDTEQDM